MKPQNEIRKIWEEMKELKRLREEGTRHYDYDDYVKLEKKYEEIEILFGHEVTLVKAVIYYLNLIKSNE